MSTHLPIWKEPLTDAQSTLPKDAKLLLLDDVLATGGTLIAADKLIRNAGFEVCGAVTLLEITFLNGNQNLFQNNIRHQSVLKS